MITRNYRGTAESILVLITAIVPCLALINQPEIVFGSYSCAHNL